MAKYLDYAGLSTVWDRIKSYVRARLKKLEVDGSNSASTASDRGKAVVKIAENASGEVVATLGDVAGSHVTITTATGNKLKPDGGSAPTSVEDALSNIGDALGSGGSVADQINTAIGNAITEDSTGHVTVTKTTDSTTGAVTYTIGENDIASANTLSGEVTRAGNAETAIDSIVGLTKASGSETRSYSNTGTYIGQQTTNTVKSDIKALDTQVKANADAIGGLGSTYKVLQTAKTDSDNDDAKIVTKITQNTQGVVTVTKKDTTDIKLTGYSKTSATGALAANDTLETGLSKLENRVNAAVTGAESTTTDYITAGVSSNKVQVAATTKTQNAVGYAESALQSVSSGDTTYLTVGSKTGNTGEKTQALTVQVATVSKTGTIAQDNLNLTGGSGVVPGSSIATIKGYVDDKITASLSNQLKYIVVNSIGDLPSTQVPAGNIYLIPDYRAVSNPTGNPKTQGWYELSGSTYVLTTDTAVQSGKTYYTKAYDEYIQIALDTNPVTYKWEKLGSASLDLGDYLEKSAIITETEINTITGISTPFS